ncbi:hypothetical protein FA95DRAFT_1611681 [Auriscalpium vulgare]|uniref:Uncharacterized protein n=1 Tax=Auriscalpium vulgare TaxID=40419 RepID=A0ACB8RAG9_9AGAM|nr:hypothetical protein FA95DRAFT_1611681 [Auriscalpium vulgare]
MAARARNPVENPEAKAPSMPEEGLSVGMASLTLTARLPRPPTQSNGNHYLVRGNGQQVEMEAWYRAADASQGVPGVHVRAFNADSNSPQPASDEADHVTPAPVASSEPSSPVKKGECEDSRSEDELRKYVVHRGFIPGLYDREGCISQVVGYGDGEVRYMRCSTEERAVQEWRRALAGREVVALGPETLAERLEQVRAFYVARQRRKQEEAAQKEQEDAMRREKARLEEAARLEREAAAQQELEAAARRKAEEASRRETKASMPQPAAACPHGCREHQRHWYVVFAGTRTGVFPTWNAMAHFVLGVPLNVHCKFPNELAARRAFQQAAEEGHVHIRGRR